MATPTAILPGWAVRAVRDRATQVRLVLRPQPVGGTGQSWRVMSSGSLLTLPYQPGQPICVRETWRSSYRHGISYKADANHWTHLAWRSPATMCREHSRLTITPGEVRVERLHSTRFEDALACGILGWVRWFGRDNLDKIRLDEGLPYANYADPVEQLAGELDAEMRYAFSCMWDSTARPGERWADNPWTIVLDKIVAEWSDNPKQPKAR